MGIFIKNIKLKFSKHQNTSSFDGSNTSAFGSQAPIISRNNKFKFNRKKVLPALGAFAGLLLAIVIGGRIIDSITGSSKANSPLLSTNEKPEAPKPLAEQPLDKSFQFSLKDQDGKEVSKVTFKVVSASLQDEIIVQGKRNVAVQGRVFLILNVKIDNTYNQGIKINSRDYVRLKINESSEFLAPEIYNDPVEVQAISTKYTRLGFALNENDNNLNLQIGEINGPKENITLDFK